jgi:hypothetical protein
MGGIRFGKEEALAVNGSKAAGTEEKMGLNMEEG